MQTTMKRINQSEAGFTLVELAIVMIIIGLLIGGVLKGQELISNAQVAAQVAELKGIDAAVSTFRDTYKAFPGDMSNAETRLANCAGDNCQDGGGDGVIDSIATYDPDTVDENMWFWGHLNAADLFSGVQTSTTAAWGQAYPAAAAGGGYHVGRHVGGDLPDGAAGRAGTYVAWHSSPGDAPAAGNANMSAASAAKIDRKMDDGSPNTGTVVALGTRAADGCAAGAANTDTYNEAENTQACGLYVRIQQ